MAISYEYVPVLKVYYSTYDDVKSNNRPFSLNVEYFTVSYCPYPVLEIYTFFNRFLPYDQDQVGFDIRKNCKSGKRKVFREYI